MTSVAEERERRLATEPLRPAGSRKGAFAGTVQSFRDVFQRRELLVMLVKRELKARYKDSTLGFVWSTIRPLVMLVVYAVVVGTFLNASKAVPDFPIFLWTGLTAWNFFNEAVQSGTGSVVANAGLVKKVFLPREVFPFSAVGSALFNFAIQLAILLGAVLVTGKFPTGSRWLYFIPALANLILYATLLALLLSTLNVFMRDIQYLVEVFLMIFMWASPIMYKWPMVFSHLNTGGFKGVLWQIYVSDPITLVIIGFQKVFWVAGDKPVNGDAANAFTASNPSPQDFPNLGIRLGIVFLVGLLLLWGAQRVFTRLQGNFAQEI